MLLGGAVTTCINFDGKGVTLSGGVEVGAFFGEGAEASIMFRVNSLPADQVDVGQTAQLTTGVVVVLGIRIFSNVAAIRRHVFHA